MFSVALLFACVAASSAHAVLPLVHSVHSPVVAAVAPAAHLGYGHGLVYGGHGLGYGGHGYGYGGYSIGYGGHSLAGYGGLGHHVLKRSPHYVTSVGHLGAGHLSGLGHVGGLGHLGGIHVPATAVSHQSRVDVHHSPAVVATAVLPVVKPVLATPLAYGAGHLGAGHLGAGHLGAGHYGAGHLGAGYLGAGHLGAGLYGADHYGAGYYGASHLGHY